MSKYKCSLYLLKHTISILPSLLVLMMGVFPLNLTLARLSVHVNTLNKIHKPVLQYVFCSTVCANKQSLSLNVLTCSAIHIFSVFYSFLVHYAMAQ